ncbi:hypothetical protein ACSU1N_06460 [Thermogladius sp. 4427co]|uniref:hypothetical protein n=1 Tax=Thermogladius sp. 4427co TaxID=3450718 RepID=UPI003F7A6BE7
MNKIRSLRESIEILCYHNEGLYERCLERFNALESLGVEGIIDFGESLISGFRVVGDGHSLVVVLAMLYLVSTHTLNGLKTSPTSQYVSREIWCSADPRVSVELSFHHRRFF